MLAPTLVLPVHGEPETSMLLPRPQSELWAISDDDFCLVSQGLFIGIGKGMFISEVKIAWQALKISSKKTSSVSTSLSDIMHRYFSQFTST